MPATATQPTIPTGCQSGTQPTADAPSAKASTSSSAREVGPQPPCVFSPIFPLSATHHRAYEPLLLALIPPSTPPLRSVTRPQHTRATPPVSPDPPASPHSHTLPPRPHSRPPAPLVSSDLQSSELTACSLALQGATSRRPTGGAATGAGAAAESPGHVHRTAGEDVMMAGEVGTDGSGISSRDQRQRGGEMLSPCREPLRLSLPGATLLCACDGSSASKRHGDGADGGEQQQSTGPDLPPVLPCQMKGLWEKPLPTVSPCRAHVAGTEAGTAAASPPVDPGASAAAPSSCEPSAFSGSRGGQLSAEQREWINEKRLLLEPYDGMVVMSLPGEHSRKPPIRSKCRLRLPACLSLVPVVGMRDRMVALCTPVPCGLWQ